MKRLVYILILLMPVTGCVTVNSTTVETMTDGYLCELTGPMWISTNSEDVALHNELAKRGVRCSNGYVVTYSARTPSDKSLFILSIITSDSFTSEI